LSIRPHRHGRRQVGVAPDRDLQGVERPDQVAVIARRGRFLGGGRIAAAAAEEAAQAGRDTEQAYVVHHGDRSWHRIPRVLIGGPLADRSRRFNTLFCRYFRRRSVFTAIAPPQWLVSTKRKAIMRQ